MVEKISQKILKASIINNNDNSIIEDKTNHTTKRKRPSTLYGCTYSIKSQLLKHTLYITINNINDNGIIKPFEMFLVCKDVSKYIELDLISKLVSASMRQNDNIEFIINSLMSKNVASDYTGYFRPPRDNDEKGQYIPSIYYEIGEMIKYHVDSINEPLNVNSSIPVSNTKKQSITNGLECPECGQHTLINAGGCLTCTDCGYSKCG